MTNPNPKRSTIPATPQQPLSLYRLVPIAEADDPRWDMATCQGEAIVRAYSPADARLVAAEAEDDYLDVKAAPGDGNSTTSASAFRDDKLYTVIDEPAGSHPANGAREVVEGKIKPDVITPTAQQSNAPNSTIRSWQK